MTAAMTTTNVYASSGMPRPTVVKERVSFFAKSFYPKVYRREVRRPYLGSELRALRQERGVGSRRRVR